MGFPGVPCPEGSVLTAGRKVSRHPWPVTRGIVGGSGGAPAQFTRTARAAFTVTVVTGPVTVNMERALKDVYKATADPKLVIALGDCAVNCGMFKGSYAVTGPVDRHIPVDVRIPGCPPRPAEILAVLRALRKDRPDSGQ